MTHVELHEGRPRKGQPPGPRVTTRTLSAAEDDWRTIERMAFEQGIGLSAFVRRAVAHFLNAQNAHRTRYAPPHCLDTMKPLSRPTRNLAHFSS